MDSAAGLPDGEEPVDADEDEHEGAEVETEHLGELEELAGEVAGEPGDRVAPDGLAAQTEHGDEEVGDGEVQDQRVHGALVPVSARVPAGGPRVSRG